MLLERWWCYDLEKNGLTHNLKMILKIWKRRFDNYEQQKNRYRIGDVTMIQFNRFMMICLEVTVKVISHGQTKQDL